MSDSIDLTQNVDTGELGPIQVLVVGFERTDLFSGEVLNELASLEDRGIIRVLDLLFVEKVSDDELQAIEISGMSAAEAETFGSAVSRLLGLDESGDDPGLASEDGATFGLDGDAISDALLEMPTGTAAGVLLFEHIWATNFRDSMRRASGFPVLQGFLTPEALALLGQETEAMREASVALEFSQIIEGAALLDATEAILAAGAIREAAGEVALEAIAESEAIRAEAAANAVRALIAAGVIEQYAAEEALEALVAAELIQSAVIEQAANALA